MSDSSFSLPFEPKAMVQELMDMNHKFLQGMENLGAIDDADIRVGETPKEAILTEENITLYRYTPVVAKLHPVPLLINYALVNRPFMVDLQQDRSLVKNLLAQGIDVYIIDWGYPRRGDKYRTMDDYINDYVDGFIDVIRERHGLEAINLLGICQGGSFSLCYAALHPEKVKNLITMVTPVDFHIKEGLLNTWAGSVYTSEALDVDLMTDAMGNVSGEFMNFGYLMLRPFALMLGKYVDMIDILDDKKKLTNFLRMEQWIFDSPDQAGEAWRQFMKDFYQGNKLIKAEVELGDERVDLNNVTMPVLNIYAEQDHLVPPASSQALEGVVGSKDYSEASFPVGHIGMYVSSKVQHSLPPTIADWLKAR